MPSRNKKKAFIGCDFYPGARERRIINYRAIIKRRFKNSLFKPIFQKPRPRAVTEGFMIMDIITNIKNAEFCIFDLTGYNPRRFPHNLNVILELGVSIGVKRRSYAIWKSGSIDLTQISDLQQAVAWRMDYENNRELGKIIAEILAMEESRRR